MTRARDQAGGRLVIRDYDFQPPHDLRLFPMPKAGVLRFDDQVFVARFKINCTTDLRGRLSPRRWFATATRCSPSIYGSTYSCAATG
jgi:hypothetical protein